MTAQLFCGRCTASDAAIEYLADDRSIAFCEHHEVLCFSLGVRLHFGHAQREQLATLLPLIREAQAKHEALAMQLRN